MGSLQHFARSVGLALTITALLPATPTSAADRPGPYNLSAAQCPDIDQVPSEDRPRVRCGVASLPEDYAHPNGRRVNVAIAIVEPKSGHMVDPVIMLHGGPGGGDMARYRYRLGEPLGPRTLILFDQRGVGHSTPTLCPELGEAVFRANVQGFSLDAENAELVLDHTRCHARLVGEGIDLTKYSTDATVADMEAIRQGLGIEKWNVYGISYGTAVGLAYLRDHADRITALVLDSVYALDRPPASNVVANMMRSLREVATACAAQPACKSRFGDLEGLFMKGLKGTIEAPIDVPAIGTSVDWADTLKISPAAYLTVVHQLLYDRGGQTDLPYLLDRVAARDGEVFALLIDEFHRRALDITHGEYAAVECYERFPFDRREDYEQASAEWPLVRDNMALIAQHFDICANWPERAQAPMRMPGKTSVPTLVLAGGWDPITPPDYSKTAAEDIGAHYVELAYWGHGVRGNQECGASMIRAFFAHPESAPDAACTRAAKPPIFTTSLIRAPAVARDLAALSQGDAMAAPAGTILAGLTAFLLISALTWTVVGATRITRNGTGAIEKFWTRPGVPLGTATAAIVATLASVIATLALAAAAPIKLMIGLPAGSAWIFVLPWLAVLCAIWGLYTLLFGAERAERPTAYAIHLWLVFAATVAAIALLATIGLLIPDFI